MLNSLLYHPIELADSWIVIGTKSNIEILYVSKIELLNIGRRFVQLLGIVAKGVYITSCKLGHVYRNQLPIPLYFYTYQLVQGGKRWEP